MHVCMVINFVYNYALSCILVIMKSLQHAYTVVSVVLSRSVQERRHKRRSTCRNHPAFSPLNHSAAAKSCSASHGVAQTVTTHTKCVATANVIVLDYQGLTN